MQYSVYPAERDCYQTANNYKAHRYFNYIHNLVCVIACVCVLAMH